MRTDLRPAVTRRSFVSLAFLSPLPAPRSQQRQPQAHMTIAEGWDWLFRWCGFAVGPARFATA